MASYITATSIQELTVKSTIVIVAKAGVKGGIINMARDVNDHSKPDPGLFGIGQIYSFEVIRYIKGDETVAGVKDIHIVQLEGLFERTPQASPSADEIEKERAVYNYTSFKPGVEYILFPNPLQDYPDLKNYFTGIAPNPWKFVLIDNCAYPESSWRGASDYFHPQLVDGFVKKVESSLTLDIKSITPPAYPVPDDAESNSACQLVPSGNVPYP